MKNFIKTFGIIALVAVIGFSMVGCKEEEDGGTVTIKISGVTNGTIYYIGPSWGTGFISASGYTVKSGVAASGTVTVSYSSDDIAVAWGEDCYVSFATSQNIATAQDAKRSKTTYKMDDKTITLTSPGDFN